MGKRYLIFEAVIKKRKTRANQQANACDGRALMYKTAYLQAARRSLITHKNKGLYLEKPHDFAVIIDVDFGSFAGPRHVMRRKFGDNAGAAQRHGGLHA